MIILIFPLAAWGVMLLWNHLMPGLAGLHEINYWQALELLALCRLLFGRLDLNMRKLDKRHREHHKMREKMARMNADERRQFREEMRSRMREHWRMRRNKPNDENNAEDLK